MSWELHVYFSIIIIPEVDKPSGFSFQGSVGKEYSYNLINTQEAFLAHYQTNYMPKGKFQTENRLVFSAFTYFINQYIHSVGYYFSQNFYWWAIIKTC